MKLETPALRRKWDKVQAHLARKEEALRSLKQTVDFPVFDSNKVFLGVLCRRGHDYQGSGKTLRLKNSNACIKCSQLKQGVKKPMIPIAYQIERTKAIAPEIDTSKFFLGTLCKKSHRYQGMEYTLRRTINRHCVECGRVKR